MQENFYDGTYKAMFYSEGIASLATQQIHKALESYPNKRNLNFPLTLELGGGEGHHFEYVKSRYQLYLLSDIRNSELTVAAENAVKSGTLKFILQDAEALTLLSQPVDRTIFSCVLHHLSNPERALIEARRVTKFGGMVSIYLPCDPGFVYRTLRRIFTTRISQKLGIDYELMNVREHTNHYYQLNKLIRTVFYNDKITVRNFPFQFASFDLNIYSIYHITIKSYPRNNSSALELET
jgi:ubiquinone/menaquinone biosynthesis C-methylase UbiE